MKTISTLAAQNTSLGLDKPAAPEIDLTIPARLDRKLHPELNGGHIAAIKAAAERMKTISQPKPGSKSAQVRALREAEAEAAEAAAKAKPAPVKAPKPIKLKWNNGSAVTPWATYRIADPMVGDKRQLIATTAAGDETVAEDTNLSNLSDAANLHALKLRESAAPAFKPAAQPVTKTETENTAMKTTAKKPAKPSESPKGAKKASTPSKDRRPAKKAASAPRSAKAARSASAPKPAKAPAPAKAPKPAKGAAPAKGETKAATVTAMLKKGWTPLADILTATGWLPHTTRAFFSGLRKPAKDGSHQGLNVERETKDGVPHYRIAK